MHANVVIALGSDETLPNILAEIHGAGLGHNAFVLKPRRTSIQRQLTRSGIPTSRMPARVDGAAAALVIHAAARATLAADITRQHGASATWIVSPAGAWTLIDDDVSAGETDTAASAPSAIRATLPAPTQAAPAEPTSDETPGI